MQNNTIAEHFELLGKLMDIHGENSFKSKTYSIAAYNIERLTVELKDIPSDSLAATTRLGKSVLEKVIELIQTGKLEVLHQYITNTPPGIIEMLKIKGLGPKKIHIIWKEMGIESIGELLYACNENRITRYKGFGEKTQQNVIEAIEFYLSNQGHFLYADMEALFPQIEGYLKQLFHPKRVAVTGAYRKNDLTIEELEFVVEEAPDVIQHKFNTAQPPEIIETTDKSILYQLKNGLKLRLYFANEYFTKTLFDTTGSQAFLHAFNNAYTDDDGTTDDATFFEKVNLPYIPPYFRETKKAILLAKENKLPQVITPEDIRAIIHSHSKWSDGSHTIQEMIEECIRKEMEYLVISDHSKTATYAGGLTEAEVQQQHKEIEELNKQYAPFKVFKSIESDILNDGSLDYNDDILSTFDLVIASIHSNLKMNEDKAMMRLIKAIENPFTRILGHPTGRLLLSRNGYPINHAVIIDACAANNVVIEINANPHRLDIDWKWIDYALEKNVLLSINPDAHNLEGYQDIKYGVLAAQKGGLTKEHNLSSFTLQQFENWLKSK